MKRPTSSPPPPARPAWKSLRRRCARTTTISGRSACTQRKANQSRTPSNNMRNRTTSILMLLVLASAIAATITFARMQQHRTAAEKQESDLAQSLRLLSDLESNKSPARLIATRLDGSDMNRRIRDAANAAGISQNLSGIEPNRPVRVRDSDYNELMVFLRFE